MHDPLYRHTIIDHYKHPRKYGKLKLFTHEAGHRNISCGDAVQFQAHIEKNEMRDVAFTGAGCAISIAAASMVAEHAVGKSFSQIKKMNQKDVEQLLKAPLSSARLMCAMLGLETLKKLRRKDM